MSHATFKAITLLTVCNCKYK